VTALLPELRKTAVDGILDGAAERDRIRRAIRLPEDSDESSAKVEDVQLPR
jgi:hypothetical protein